MWMHVCVSIDLIATGTKMQEMGRVVVRGETTSAALLSLQLQDAAKELQLLEETYWLFLLDPMAIKEEVRPNEMSNFVIRQQ